MKSRRKSPVTMTFTEPQHCSMDLRLKILARLPFFAGLSKKDLDAINQRFVEVGYPAGDVIYTAGQPAERLFVVAEGKVKLLQHASGGRDVLLDILTSGEFFGNLAVLGAAQYTDTAKAQTQSCILSLQSEGFHLILDEHPELAVRSLTVVAERLNAANKRLLQLVSMPVEKRIASTLLNLADKLGQPRDVGLLIDTPLSRDDLAEMTGTTPETASRVMSQFQSAGLIDSGRQWIAVTDREGLTSLAGEA